MDFNHDRSYSSSFSGHLTKFMCVRPKLLQDLTRAVSIQLFFTNNTKCNVVKAIIDKINANERKVFRLTSFKIKRQEDSFFIVQFK